MAMSKQPQIRSNRWVVLAPIAGLLPVLVLGLWLGAKGEGHDWAQQIAAGLVFGGVFAIAWLSGWRPCGLTLAVSVGTLMMLCVVIASQGLPGFDASFAVVGMMMGTGYWFGRRGESTAIVEAVCVSIAGALGVWAMARLSWWEPLGMRLVGWERRWWLFGLTGIVVACLVAEQRSERTGRGGRRYLLLDAVMLCLLAVAVMRTTGMADNIVAAHHWSVLTGPAEMVREGRALLGQVPSQYGFLSILVLAAIPAENCYAALYGLQVIALWLSGAILYVVWRQWLAVWWWQIVAGLIVVCGVAFISGDTSILGGPMGYPSVGAVRFIWIYFLLGWLFWWQFKASPQTSLRHALWTGNAIWLGGVLWSVESAIYVTAAWLPAASVLAMRNEPGPEGCERWRALLQGISVVLSQVTLLLAVAIAAIWIAYRLIYQRSPDWPAFWEYAVSFTTSSGTLALPIDSQGPGWAMLLVHIALLAAVVAAESRRLLALIWAAWGALWAVGTYYTARSHPNAVANLAPVVLLIIGLLAHAAKDTAARAPMRPWSWLAMAVWLGAMLWLVATNPAMLRRQVADYQIKPRVDRLLPAQQEATQLLVECLAAQSAPYSVIGINNFATTRIELTTAHANWLPLRSLGSLRPLRTERWSHYLDIYHDRAMAGWLLAPVYVDRYDLRWLFDYIHARYRATDYRRNAGWQAWFFEPKAVADSSEFTRRTRGPGAAIDFLQEFGGTADPRLVTTSAQLFATDKRNGLIGVTEGSAEMRLRFSTNRLRAALVLRRKDGEGVLAADFAVYASPAQRPGDRYERWRGRVELPRGDEEVMLRPEIDGSALDTVFNVEIPAEFSGRVIAGWRNPDVTHVTYDSIEPAWLFPGRGPATVLDETALDRLLPAGWRPTEAWMRRGRVTKDGIELAPGGEIWLKAPMQSLRIAGTALRGDGAPHPGVNITGLWYKGGRVHFYYPPMREDPLTGVRSFQARSAEPGGWLVVVADDGEPWVPVVIRVTEVSEP